MSELKHELAVAVDLARSAGAAILEQYQGPINIEQKHFDEASKRGRLRLIASPDGHDGSLGLHADASISAGLFDRGESAEVALDPKRRAWVQVVRGKVAVNGQALSAGDAVGLQDETVLKIADGDKAEVLVFDLA